MLTAEPDSTPLHTLVEFDRLQLDAALDMYDAVLHIGDFAYDLDDDDGKVGDEFMRMVEPLTARAPYMVAAGNHEKHQ